ncbi:IS21-like element helper ATPase IstB [Roseateles violae]|uniref:IS21-like element helper ATPase IstB n=1 Tax=Roseateles violae TaxID=3058042 RepID=A0ABT8DW44_9BURK|nr:IS21-like element helper ATPase IstB [Pelomonas sp. PFR6]MDN3922520.1 IS21-like element helper ATPase IstB [Pelomonas sp. PFR6]
MMNNETIRKLHAMKLYGMASAVEVQATTAAVSDLSFEERFGMVVDQESSFRDNKRLSRLLKAAKFREPTACVEDIYYGAERGIDRSRLASLTHCNWIRSGQNLLFTGVTGSGKTWMGCALGNQACRFGMSVLFKRVPLLLEDLAMSHSDGTFRKQLAQLGRPDLLILDDLGISPINSMGRADLLEVIEQRAGSKSVLITSQLPIDRWHDYLTTGGKSGAGGNATQADAILDRLVSGSHRLDLRGDSLRKSTKAGQKGSKDSSEKP